jgi:hypothetical protein
MSPSTIEAALAGYISALARSAETTERAEERPRYQRHLASAALMFAAIHAGDAGRLRDIVDNETRAFGWDSLSGDSGRRAEEAWERFREAAAGGLGPR